MDCKGQVSAELLIIIAAVLAVAILLVTNMKTTATKASGSMSNKSDALLNEIDSILANKS